MSKKLEGKVAVVTGGSKGIGAAIAKELAAAGAKVVVNYASSKEGAEKTVAEITSKGGKAIAVHGDISKQADITHLFAETKKAYGQLDILVNNAGVYQFAPIEEVTEELFHKQFNLNVLGLLLTTKEAVIYNGEIIAYETASSPAKLVGLMLKKALNKLTAADNLILHSDQGWQYRMPAYQQMLREKQVVQSMSRKGNCLDNAAMESFFGTLKSELFYLEKFKNPEDLQDGIKAYIHYYNHDRIKLKLKGLSPVQYRTQSLMSA